MSFFWTPSVDTSYLSRNDANAFKHRESKFGPRSLPPQMMMNPSPFPADTRKTLVLDLDETLVHACAFPPHPDVKSYKFGEDSDWIFLRPKVEEFLDKVTQMFEVFIFTAGTKEYADLILDNLCPQIDVMHRHYRDSCIMKSHKVKKDLKIFGKPLSDIIMVDDNISMRDFYPDNTIYIQKWNGMPQDDVLMGDIFPILEQCAQADDVRKVIKKLPKSSLLI